MPTSRPPGPSARQRRDDLRRLELNHSARSVRLRCDDQIEVRPVATGLNFRDVLSALGQMPGVGSGPLVPGGECSGIVRAVGPGVRHLAPGDRVVAIARGCLGTDVTTAAHAVARMPGNLDFKRAACLGLAALTAFHCVETVDPSEGDVVLVVGKGHEKYQVIGDQVLSFDDVAVAREALVRRRSNSGVV